MFLVYSFLLLVVRPGAPSSVLANHNCGFASATIHPSLHRNRCKITQVCFRVVVVVVGVVVVVVLLVVVVFVVVAAAAAAAATIAIASD